MAKCLLPPPMIKVDWEDSSVVNGWQSPKALKRWFNGGDFGCSTTGYLIGEDDTAIAVALNVWPHNGGISYSEVIRIPKGIITRRETLPVGDN